MWGVVLCPRVRVRHHARGGQFFEFGGNKMIENRKNCLTGRDRAQLTGIILQRIEEEKERIQKARIYLRQSQEISIDDGDRAAHEEETDRTCLQVERSGNMLRKLDRQLDAIRQGKFLGCCKGCGEEIGMARLTIKPTTWHCTGCNAEKDFAEKRRFALFPGVRIMQSAHAR